MVVFVACCYTLTRYRAFWFVMSHFLASYFSILHFMLIITIRYMSADVLTRKYPATRTLMSSRMPPASTKENF